MTTSTTARLVSSDTFRAETPMTTCNGRAAAQVVVSVWTGCDFTTHPVARPAITAAATAPRRRIRTAPVASVDGPALGDRECPSYRCARGDGTDRCGQPSAHGRAQRRQP